GEAEAHAVGPVVVVGFFGERDEPTDGAGHVPGRERATERADALERQDLEIAGRARGPFELQPQLGHVAADPGAPGARAEQRDVEEDRGHGFAAAPPSAVAGAAGRSVPLGPLPFVSSTSE